MGFSQGQQRRARRGRLAGLATAPAQAGARLLTDALRLSLALIVMAAFLALVLWMRLAQGPVELPWLAEILAQQVNRSSEDLSIEVEGVDLSLGGEGRPAGLTFTGVTVADRTGTTLLAVPRLAARFRPFDLLSGQVRPVEITLQGAAARIVRMPDGRIRVALQDGPDLEAGETEARRDFGPGMDAVARVVDGFVGDGTPVPELARLKRVSILDADITYENPELGRSWRSRQADLTLMQTATGARLNLDLDVIGALDDGGRGGGATLSVIADRHRGATATGVDVAFAGVRPEHLAAELPQLGFLALFKAPFSGRLAAALGDDGSVGELSGHLAAEDGRVLAVEEGGMPFDRFAFDFAYQPDGRRMRVERLEIAAKAADLDLSGFADLSLDAEGTPHSLAAQLDIAALRLALPRLFADEQRFGDGQIVARVDLDTLEVEVAEARLTQGALALAVSGRARPDEHGNWTTDLRVTGRDIAVDRLVALWPLPAAKGARRWLAANLREGRVEEVLAHLRLGAAEPEVDLSFRYSDLSVAYLKEMSPIRGASGMGHLTWESFDLTVDQGWVEPVPGQRIGVAGSTVRIAPILQDPAPASIVVRGRGPTSAILSLIDQEPLALTRKLDLDPKSVEGTAEVETLLSMPLDKDLKLAQVEAETTARLSDVRMPFALKLTGPMRIAADRLELAATTRDMTLAGDITADGTPVRLDWEERFSGPTRGRDVRIRGRVTPAALSGININIPGFDGGAADADLTIRQAPGTPTQLQVTADLGPAAVSVEPLFWSKPAGLAATVSAAGQFDQRLVLDSLLLSGPGLEAEGSLSLFPAGGIERAAFDRLDMGALADLFVEVTAAGEGFALDIGGRWFDLAFLDRSPGEPEPPVTPLTASFAIDQAQITEGIKLALAEGTFSRTPDGRLSAEVTGRVAGTAPVEIAYVRTPGQPGRATVTAADAGKVLQAAGLFAGATGGRLVLDAAIAPDHATSIKGTAIIKDVVVRQEARTFQRVLEKGALPDAAEETQSGGMAFERVEVPFAIRGDRIEIGTALATSPSLAIKLSGLVDQASERLSLRGVISPAYALTGALNNIPLLGTLLGGEGEGILAMTFQVGGTTGSPVIQVNPLSLLAPGFLRNIFEGGPLPDLPPTESSTVSRRIKQAAERTTRPPPEDPAAAAAAAAEQASRLRDLLNSKP